MDTSNAADLAENMRVWLEGELIEHGLHMPRRPMDSLQDVVFWLLMTEAVTKP